MPAAAQILPGERQQPSNFSILIASPCREDHTRLGAILNQQGFAVSRCASLTETFEYLGKRPCSVVICERDLPDGDWKEILRRAENMPSPPLVLVVSKHADESLWGEVLNLGGFDVLLKPFDVSEVTRVVAMACRTLLSPVFPPMSPNLA